MTQSVLVNTNPIFPLADVESFTVDAVSATIPVGFGVCLTSTGTVTLAVAAALAAANGLLGVAITAGAPGQSIQVRENGFLSPSISGLSSPGLVRVNPATGALQVVGSYGSSDFPVGGSTADGWVTMQRLLPNTGGGGVSVTGTGYWHSTGGALDPAAAVVITQPGISATSGFVQTNNNVTALAARNAANTANIPLLGTDASNNVNLGDSAGAQGALTVLNGTTGIVGKVAGVTTLQLANASTDFIKFGVSPASAGLIRVSEINVNQTVIGAFATDGSTVLNIVGIQSGSLLIGDTTSAFGLGGAEVVSASLARFRTLNGSFGINGSVATSTSLSGFTVSAFSGNYAFDTDASATGWNHNINGTVVTAITAAKFTTKKGINRAVRRVATSTTLTTSDDIVIFSASGQTATLPSSPAAGDKYTIGLDAANVADTYSIAGPASSIIVQGSAVTTLTVTTNATSFQAYSLTWTGSFWLAVPGY